MNRLQQRFDRLKQENRKALVVYLVAGDPEPSYTVSAMHTLVEAGADVIELGVPFSDPSAEGPSIQRGHERALAHSVGLNRIFEMVREFRATDATTPIVLMGYANPIEWMGYDTFVSAASAVGVDAALTVDIPPEEASEMNQRLEEQGMLSVFLLAPTTSDARMQSIVDAASGFIYYVSLKGVTGSSQINVADVSQRVSAIRSRTPLPICVGFGIKNAATAAAVASVADGVVIGSALVDLMAQSESSELANQRVYQLTAEIRAAIDL